MAGIDASIPLGVQQPNGMKMLSDMIGMKTAIQGQQLQQQSMQANAMANQQSQIDLQETQAAQQVMKNVQNYQDANGNIDYNKLLPDMMQAAPKNGAKFVQNIMAMQQQATVAKQSWLAASDEQRTQFGKIATSLVGQPPEVAMKTMEALKSSPMFANMTPSIDHFVQTGIAPAAQNGNQKTLDDALYRIGKMAETPASQQAMNTPGGVAVGNGQQTAVVSTKPGTAVEPGQVVPGTLQQQQLPPTTPIVSENGTPGYLGAQAGGSAVFELSGDKIRDMGMLNSIANDQKMPPDIRAQAQAKLKEVQGGKFVASALPPGQAGNIESNFQEMNRHFATLNDASSGAQLIQGLTGNIKALAPKAITGAESDKLAYANGLLAQFGWGHADDLKTATDLLDKNATQLNLGTPAGTDAARALISAARPNSHMSVEAIQEAADQVASQVKANMAMRNVLQGYKAMGDVPAYMAARAKLEGVADPRAWQYEALGPGTPAAKAFISKLTPADRAELGAKIQKLEEMGMLK